jgi:hypothetical protein
MTHGDAANESKTGHDDSPHFQVRRATTADAEVERVGFVARDGEMVWKREAVGSPR